MQDQLLTMLQLSRSSFYAMKRRGQLPFLEELQPRIGTRARYRADLVDRYLEGRLHQTAFGQARLRRA